VFDTAADASRSARHIRTYPRIASFLERAQLLLQSDSRQALHAFVRDWRPQLDSIKPRMACWSLDVDPRVL
jgi:primosomal protein N' (replication factor Y)